VSVDLEFLTDRPHCLKEHVRVKKFEAMLLGGKTMAMLADALMSAIGIRVPQAVGKQGNRRRGFGV
jgi:Asp/Glu/hydantoin racemase